MEMVPLKAVVLTILIRARRAEHTVTKRMAFTGIVVRGWF
jgi:hypothetical protein